MKRPFLQALALAALSIGGPAPTSAQIPDEFRNLQVLPEDIDHDSLVFLMRSFSFATGLRCEECHVMGEDGAFIGARFDLDEKPLKKKARAMLRMVNRLNAEFLPGLPDRASPPLWVECKTCHRGLHRPDLLRTELHRVVDEEGVDAAVARYRELRADRMDLGAYDFGVWEMMELARELEKEGKVAEAAVMLELNEEFHPRSASIPRELGSIYERLGRTGDAVAAYRRTLGLNPDDARTLARLRELTGEPSGGG